MPKGIYQHKPLSEEHKRKIGFANKDKTVPIESRIKISLANKGKNFTGIKNGEKTRFKKGQITWNKGVSYDNPKLKIIQKTNGFKIKQRLSHSGNKCHFWKGGITPLRKRIYSLFEWKKWRSDIFERDNWTCQTCGKRGCYLEAHHIKEFNKIIEEFNIINIDSAIKCKELWNINNGVCLCKECHNLTKRGNPNIKNLTKIVC